MTAPLARFKKDPDATLDYTIEWSRWLAGDTINASSWVVSSGLTVTSQSFTQIAGTVWVSGGTIGQTYTLTNRINTVAGRTDDRSITIQVESR